MKPIAIRMLFPAACAPVHIVLVALMLVTVTALRSQAGVPSPPNITKPNVIAIVGTQGGVPDSTGGFDVIIRDIGNHPIFNSRVIVDLYACTDVRLCNVAPPGQIIDCVGKTIRGGTDINGRIHFVIVGAGTNTGMAPGPGAGCANITYDGMSAIHPTVVIYDQNGAATPGIPGMEVTDLTAFLRDLGSGLYFGRSDYSALFAQDQGVISVVDLSKMLVRLGTGYSAEGCTTTLCP
jgi:hypothetical protein